MAAQEFLSVHLQFNEKEFVFGSFGFCPKFKALAQDGLNSTKLVKKDWTACSYE